MGKSNVLAFAALILKQLKPESTIYMMYSNEGLRSKDDRLLSDLMAVAGKGFKLKSVLANGSQKPKANDIVLVDECDDVYLQNLKWFEKTMEKPYVIGVTATTDNQEEMLES